MNRQNEPKKTSKQDIAIYILKLRRLLKKKPNSTTVLDCIVYWKNRFATAPYSPEQDENNLHPQQRNSRRLAANRISALITA